MIKHIIRPIFQNRPGLRGKFWWNKDTQMKELISTDQTNEKAEVIVKNYLQELETKQSDFKAEFGFPDSLKSVRKTVIKREKKVKRQLEVILTFVLVLGNIMNLLPIRILI